MITPEQILARLERQYPRFLQAWLQGETLFPLELAVGEIPKKDFLQLRQAIEKLRAGAKEQIGYGYTIIWEQVNVRGADRQTLPARIVVESEADYLRLLRKKREFDTFVKDVADIRGRLPELDSWLLTNPLQVVNHAGEWEQFIEVCTYFLANPRPALYLRELPIPVHTKFIEEHAGILRGLLDFLLPEEFIATSHTDIARRYGLRYEEPLVRFRLLDPALKAQLSLPFDDLSVPLSGFARLNPGPRTCIIVENKMTFLTLPVLRNSIGIFGSGFKVDVLSQVAWLRNCALVYWGDLDAQGFQILSLLRSTFPSAASVLMDAQTLTKFQDRVRQGREMKLVELPFLTFDERAVFEQLVAQNWRLEQEQIDHTYAVAQLRVSMG